MHPSQVSARLRQIAAKIEKSKNPRRDLVAKDIRRILAGLHEQGDPDSSGYSLTCTLKDHETEVTEAAFSINGKMDGQVISGILHLYFAPKLYSPADPLEVANADYEPDPGSYNILNDQSKLEIIQKLCIDELRSLHLS
jgi:hypothetical protein